MGLRQTSPPRLPVLVLVHCTLPGFSPTATSPQAGENPESLCPGLPMTTGNCSQGRQPPGQAVFALSQSVQLSFLPAGVFFLCQL